MKRSSIDYYDEKLVSSCISLLENGNEPLSAPEDLPPDCWILLFQQHHHSAEKTSIVKDDESRLHSFLENIMLTHGRRRSLQRSDDSLKSVLSAAINTKNDAWFQLWENQDWETQTLVRGGLTVMRLHDEESVKRAANLHGFSLDGRRMAKKPRLRHGRPNKNTTIVASSFIKDYSHLRIAQDDDFSKSSIDNDKSKKHFHSQRGSFETHLNWASEENPDGVNIVHEAHDQVRRSCDTTTVVSVSLTSLVGTLWKLLGMVCNWFVGSKYLAKNRLSSVPEGGSEPEYK